MIALTGVSLLSFSLSCADLGFVGFGGVFCFLEDANGAASGFA